jgi:AcrR family transcriptional regulator
MALRKKPIQARSANTVELLLDAGIQVLRRSGYAHFTTTRIAERAGVSVGTFYQYFNDKHALIDALKTRYLTALVAHMATAGELRRGERLHVSIPKLIASLFAFKRQTLELAQALREPLAEPQHRAATMQAAAGLTRIVAAVLAAATPPCPNPERVASVLTAAIEGVLANALARSGDALSADLEAELCTLATGYIRAVRKG